MRAITIMMTNCKPATEKRSTLLQITPDTVFCFNDSATSSTLKPD